MDYYAGLDVSLEETAVCIVDAQGTLVKEAKVASDPEALIGFFEGLGLSMGRIGLEACSLTAWLHERLSAAGLPVVCMETRQAKAAMGAMPIKTDRNDARGLAQIVRTGWFRPVTRQERAMPILAGVAERAAPGAEQAARHREWCAGAAARGRDQAGNAWTQEIRCTGSRIGGFRRRPGGLG